MLTEQEVVTLLNGLQAIPRTGLTSEEVLTEAAQLTEQLEAVLRAMLKAFGAGQ